MVLAGRWKGWLICWSGVWAYYHVIRQHYGFMVLYKVKSRDLRPVDNLLDRVFLGVMLVFPPFHRFFIHHPEELGLPFRFARAWSRPCGRIVAATGPGLPGPAVDAMALRRAGQPYPKYLLVRGHRPAALADFRVHELAGRRPHRDHRPQPAIPRHRLVPQSQPLCRRG